METYVKIIIGILFRIDRPEMIQKRGEKNDGVRNNELSVVFISMNKTWRKCAKYRGRK